MDVSVRVMIKRMRGKKRRRSRQRIIQQHRVNINISVL